MKAKKIFLFLSLFIALTLLFSFNNVYATQGKEITVTTSEEFKTAMADDTYEIVTLGANITLTSENTPSNYSIIIDEEVHRKLDLNGYTLRQEDEVKAKIDFKGNDKKFQIGNSGAYDTGKIEATSNFGDVFNESEYNQNNEIIFTHFRYYNINSGNGVFIRGNANASEVTFVVDRVAFYYPNNAPLNEALKLRITSMSVFTHDQTGPMGFYNDGNEKHLSDILEEWHEIYVNEVLREDNRDTTWARDIYVSYYSYEQKIEIISLPTYDVWVEGQRFYGSNLIKNCGEGTATFDPETATLTLNNATIADTYEWQPWYEASIYSELPLINIRLVGTNNISPNTSYGDTIDVPAGCSVRIFGGGTLNITGGYYGTYIGKGGGAESNLTLDGVTVNINNTNAAGLWVNNNIDIKDSYVYVFKDNSNYSGFVSNENGTITINNSVVNATTIGQPIHFGNPFTNPPSNRFHIISGTVTLTATADGADVIHVQPYVPGGEDPDIYNFDISLDDGYLELNVPKGSGMGINAPDDQIHLLSNMVYTKGTSVKDCSTETEGITIVVQSKPFPDVEVGKWYTNSIRYVMNYGMMSGYSSGANAGKFGLNDLIKRGQIAVMLYRLAGSPLDDVDINTLVSPFPDVQDSSKYYYRAAIWANQNGIVTGYTSGANEGKFGPNDYIKRQDLAVMLARYADKIEHIDITSTYSLDTFIDSDKVSGYAANSLKYIVEKGVITGNDKLGPTQLRILPRDNAKRSEAATMVERFCHNVLNMP